MTPRIQQVVDDFDFHSMESIHATLASVNQLHDLDKNEKVDVVKALSEIFYHAHHTGSSELPRLAVSTERSIARLGEEVIPILFEEILETDSESVAYFGQTISKLGNPAYDFILSRVEEFKDKEQQLLNLLHVLSYFKGGAAINAIRTLVGFTSHSNPQVIAMATYAIGRLIQKSKPRFVSHELMNQTFTLIFGLLSHSKVIVKKNAVDTLGRMLRKGNLDEDQKIKLLKAFLSISGRDDHHNWDRAFIVRRQAEEYLSYFHHTSKPSDKYGQSYKILSKELLAPHTYHFTIDAPLIARKIEAGQFIIVRPHILSERIPLSICGWDREKGTIDIVVFAVGKTTTQINLMQVGKTFQDVVGPLGNRSNLPSTKGTCIVIGGGYGTGAIIPTAKEMKQMGNRVIGIVGARNKENLIMVNELKSVCDEVIVTTNDGSEGMQGFVTNALQVVLDREPVHHVLAIGPVPMMKAVSDITKRTNIETFVSLNAIMVDGTGMCGACRVTVGNETKFACFHGPDFDGHHVDFENLMKRQKMFTKEEKTAFAVMNN